MKARGAVIVDPADIPTASKLDACEMEVLLYEFKADLNKYLAALGPAVHTVARFNEVIEFNEREAAREMPYFGQELFVSAQKKGPLTSRGVSSSARDMPDPVAHPGHRSQSCACTGWMRWLRPTGGPAWTTDLVNGDHFIGASSTPAAVAGYPSDHRSGRSRVRTACRSVVHRPGLVGT